MHNKYYYLVASLPFLQFDEKLPISREAFFEECRKWVDLGDLGMLEGLNIKEPDTSDEDRPLVRQWKTFDLDLREMIAGYRGENEHAIKRAMPDLVKDVFDEESPLVREKVIEKIRWTFIEGEEYKHLFNANTLVLYYLKLQILERLTQFEHDKGKQNFNNLCEVEYGETKG